MVIKLDRLSAFKDLGSLFDLYIKGWLFKTYDIVSLKVSNSLVAVGELGCYNPIMSWAMAFEPRHEKTGFLHMRKQRRRSASR